MKAFKIVSKTIKKKFAKDLRQMRIDSGLGVREFAMEIGFSPAYVVKVEKGELPVNDSTEALIEKVLRKSKKSKKAKPQQ